MKRISKCGLIPSWKMILLLMTISLIGSDLVIAQTFHRIYQPPNSLNAWGYCVQPTDDGGYIVAGRADASTVNISRDALLIKTDANGIIQWTFDYQRVLINDLMEEARYVIEVDDFPMDGEPDGYVFVGWTIDLAGDPQFPIVTDKDILAVKTDMNGTILWFEQYTDPLNDHDEEAFCVKQNPNNGNYVITGVAEIDPTRMSDSRLFLMEVNQHTGAIVWDDLYGRTSVLGTPETGGYSMDFHDFDGDESDDGWIVAGWTSENPTFGNYAGLDIYLVAVDWNGNPSALRRVGVEVGDLGYISDELGLSVQQISNGDIIVSGQHQASNQNPQNSGVTLLSVTGNLAAVNWMRSYSGTNFRLHAGHSVREYNSGLVVASGGSMLAAYPVDNESTPQMADLVMFGTTANGAAITFANSYLPATSGYTVPHGSAHSVRVDGQGFVMTGVDQAFTSPQSVHLVRTDLLGNTTCEFEPLEVDIVTLDPYIADHGFKTGITFDDVDPVTGQWDDIDEDDVCTLPKSVIFPGDDANDPFNFINSYPSPAQTGTEVSLELKLENEPSLVSVVISDMLGNVVLSREVEYADVDGLLNFTTIGWSAGTYNVTVRSGEEQYSDKFVLH